MTDENGNKMHHTKIEIVKTIYDVDGEDEVRVEAVWESRRPYPPVPEGTKPTDTQAYRESIARFLQDASERMLARGSV